MVYVVVVAMRQHDHEVEHVTGVVMPIPPFLILSRHWQFMKNFIFFWKERNFKRDVKHDWGMRGLSDV
jgi:hypothetical protein